MAAPCLLCLGVAGALFFPALYLTTSKLLSKLGHGVLSRVDIHIIAERAVCTAQGVIACIVGAVIVYNCHKDVLGDTHWGTNAYAAFGTPYFLYDTVVMYTTYCLKTPGTERMSLWDSVRKFIKAQPLMVLHHLGFPVAYLPVIVWWRGNRGDFFVGCFYLIELAIPCLSFRAVLIQLKREKTRLFIVNGLLLIATWFVCRLLVFPFMFWAYGRQHAAPWWRVPSLIPVKCNVGCLLLAAFQLYWFCVMVRIALRTLVWGPRGHTRDNKKLA